LRDLHSSSVEKLLDLIQIKVAMASGYIEGARFEPFKPSDNEAAFRPVSIDDQEGLNAHLRAEAAPGHPNAHWRIDRRKNLENCNRKPSRNPFHGPISIKQPRSA
jgi:hypothetical protein